MTPSPQLEPVTRCFLCGAEPSRLLFRIPPFGYQECAVCGLVRLAPRVAPADLPRLYDEEWPYDAAPVPESASDDRGPANPSFPYRSRRLNAFTPGRSFLEFGCGDGSFLAYQRQQGWQVAGTELSPSGVTAAWTKYRIRVDRACAEAPQIAGRYDAVGLYHVLEHLYEPRPVLEAIHQALAPRGILHVQVPNRRSLDGRLGRQFWPGLLCPQHVYLYEPSQLLRLMDERFQVLSTETYDPWHGPFSVEVTLRSLVRRWLRREPLSQSLPIHSRATNPAAREIEPSRRQQLTAVALRRVATLVARAQSMAGWGNVVDVIARAE